MMARLTVLFAGVLALVALSACSFSAAPRHPEPIVRDRDGPVRRVVSLDPCNDAILAEVANPDQIAALSAWSRDPQQSSMSVALAQHWPATHGTLEDVVALRPDLVLGTPFTPPQQRAALAALGIAEIAPPLASDLAGARAQITAIAAAVGHPARGAALIARIDAALAAAHPRAGAMPIPTLLWEPGGIVAGQHTLIAQLLAEAGLGDAAVARGLGQGSRLPLEAVLAAPPRLIVTVGAPGAHGSPLDHPALASLPGVARAWLTTSLVYCGGPTIPRTLARLRVIRAQVAGT